MMSSCTTTRSTRTTKTTRRCSSSSATTTTTTTNRSVLRRSRSNNNNCSSSSSNRKQVHCSTTTTLSSSSFIKILQLLQTMSSSSSIMSLLRVVSLLFLFGSFSTSPPRTTTVTTSQSRLVSSTSTMFMVVLAVDTDTTAEVQTSRGRGTTSEQEKRQRQQNQNQQNQQQQIQTSHEQYEQYRQEQNQLIVSIDNSSYLDPLSAMYHNHNHHQKRNQNQQPSRIIYADPSEIDDVDGNKVAEETIDHSTTTTKTRAVSEKSDRNGDGGEKEEEEGTNENGKNDPNHNENDIFHETFLNHDLEYLGILVDAGRHYFPIPWLKRLLKQMYLLNYNLLHLRLTDDQIFAIQLQDSHHHHLSELTFGSVVTQYYYTPSPKEEGNGSSSSTTTATTGGNKKPRNGSSSSSANRHHPAHNKHKNYYTIEDLRNLNEYAKSLNITIMPEINIPGHGGSWAGIKGLIVDTCPIFICNKGYGIPLNVTHPKFLPILKDILQQIINIFTENGNGSNNVVGPTFLHLGGDEVHMSLECIKEGILNGQIHVNEQLLTDDEGNDYSDLTDHRNLDYVVKNIFDYTYFEDQVRTMIEKELQYNENTIVRWERTIPSNRKDTQNYENKNKRVGNMLHFWETLPGQYLNSTKGPYFVSRGLYMDTNKMDGAYPIYHKTRQIIRNSVIHDAKANNKNVYLRGIIVGAFELSPANFWDRNILGRMLAVSMGVYSTKKQLQSYVNKTTVFVPERGSTVPQGEHTFHQHYKHYCEDVLQWPKWLCSKQGVPTLPQERYGAKWSQTWNKWIEGICTRVTEYKETLEVRFNKAQHRVLMENVFSSYWQDYGDVEIENDGDGGSGNIEDGETTTQRQLQQHPQIDDQGNSEEHDASSSSSSSSSSNVLLDEMFRHHQVENVGILLDLVNSLVLPETIQSIMNHTMSSLGLNFLQLRFVDDSGFSLSLGGDNEIKTVGGFVDSGVGQGIHDLVFDVDTTKRKKKRKGRRRETTVGPPRRNQPGELNFDEQEENQLEGLSEILPSSSSTASYKKIFFLDRLAHVIDPPLWGRPYTNQDLLDIASTAKYFNIQIMPELSISTNAGGWFNGGFLVNCPQVLCANKKMQRDGSTRTTPPTQSVMVHNVTRGTLLPLLTTVIQQLKDAFHSPYIHLGGDERNLSMACIQEGGLAVHESDGIALLDDFERRFTMLLQMQHLYDDPSYIVRWNNHEQTRYKTRTGHVTQYRSTDDPPKESHEKSDQFFATVSLVDRDEVDVGSVVRQGTSRSGWAIYQNTVEWVKHQPKGLVAEIRTFSSDTWEELNYPQALLAFAIGTASSSRHDDDGNPILLDHGEFVKLYVPLCTELLLKVSNDEILEKHWNTYYSRRRTTRVKRDKNALHIDCVKFASKKNEKSVSIPPLRVEQDTFLDKKCDHLTKFEYKPIPRDQALSTLAGLPNRYTEYGTPTEDEVPYINYHDDDNDDTNEVQQQANKGGRWPIW